MSEATKLSKLDKLIVWVNHNRFKAIAIMATGALCLAIFGCEATTPSVLNDGMVINAAGLEGEMAEIQADFDMKVAKIDIAKADLQRQMLWRATIVEIGGKLGEAAITGTMNPAAGLALGLQALTATLAVGAYADNRRKDGVIKDVKAKNKA